MNTRLLWLALPPLAMLTQTQAATAQLISPGELAAPHSDLRGVRNCTSCHALGKRGISNDKCLDCHEPVRSRVQQRRGLHSDVLQENCADCHKEHFGEDFELVTFDTATFDHQTVGFELIEAHRAATCDDCHRPQLITATNVLQFKGEHGALDRTFLGLGTTCVACHSAETPHGDQFGKQDCEECHAQTTWDRAELFDHDRSRYRLTGLHRRVACRDCHTPTHSSRAGPAASVQYAMLSYSTCLSCHRDEHRGVMGSACANCHNTTGWRSIDRSSFESRFDHEATNFPLAGRHADLDCAQCHDRNQPLREGLMLTYSEGTGRSAYPQPAAEDCISCHLDYHEGAFEDSPGGPSCEDCHTQQSWVPTMYDIERHNAGATFILTGAHVATPCQACHSNRTTADGTPLFHFESTECQSCHTSHDPHSGQFAGQQCSACHDTDSFEVGWFDHTTTRYPLDGAHRSVPCADCHSLERDSNGRAYRVYKPLGTDCRDCHGDGQ